MTTGQDAPGLVARLRKQIERSRMSYTDLFEDSAAEFYRRTGFMAPGKSMPLEMAASVDEDARQAAWVKWQDAQRQQWRDDLEAIIALAASRATPEPQTLWPNAARDAADADSLSELQAYIRHNAVLPSDHVGNGRVVPLSHLRGWIQREREKRKPRATPEPIRRNMSDF